MGHPFQELCYKKKKRKIKPSLEKEVEVFGLKMGEITIYFYVIKKDPA